MKEEKQNKKENYLPEVLQDRFNYTHKIVDELAQGGQGKILSTDDENVIIKLATKNIGSELLPVNEIIDKKKYPEEYKHYQSLFQNIKLLPLPKNIHVTVPQALILDKAGYVMRFMGKMEKIGNSICMNNNILEYAKSGSTRRRLELSCKAFTILAQLHSSGIIFGDISPNNIFVSTNKKMQTPNVWFIDSDNMTRLSAAANGCFTPKYGAPELAKGTGLNSMESDVYSLAIVCFYLCSSAYPFYGQRLEESDWANDDAGSDGEDLYTKAHNGDLPFIDDAEDDSNFSEEGLPRELVFTDELRFLFNKMFSEQGRTKPETRPTVYHWIRAFSRAADVSVQCGNENCIQGYKHPSIKNNKSVTIRNMTYIMKTPESCCPYCDSPFSSGVILLKNEEVVFAREFSFSDEKNFSVSIPERVFKSFNVDTNGQTILSIVVQKNIRDNLIKLVIPKAFFSIEDSFSAKIDYKNHSKLTSFICDKNQNIDCKLTVKIGSRKETEYKLLIKIPMDKNTKKKGM